MTRAPLLAKQDEREVHPEGMVKCVCIGVHDIGMQDTRMYGYKHQVILRFETSAKMTLGTNAGKPFTMSGWYTLSMNKKAVLRQHVEGFLGRSFTEQEVLNGFDLYQLEGRSGYMTVTHNDKGKAVIKSISPLPEEVSPLQPVNKVGEEPEWVKEFQKKQVILKPISVTEEPAQTEDADSTVPF